jgi:TRAP-type mannitol/chloroaromatic compound transport system substrate-binding protein
MRRRDVLAGAATLALPLPAVAKGIRELKMVTDWPEGTPGLHTGSVRLAHTIGMVTQGRIKIEVFPSGTLVRPFETFDAVSAGLADMYHSDEYYFEKKSPAFNFFSAVPFGFTADELFAWVHYGGGQELWDTLSGKFNVKALLCLNTGTQMGGWFTREIASSDQFKGLRYRMPGLGAEVLRRTGAIVVTLPGSEIVPALKSGALDASEWVSPWLDMAMGLHEAANYYYYPGFHEPGTGTALGINKGVWESLGSDDQRVIADVTACEYARSLAEFNANNAMALHKLRQQGSVKLLRFDDAILRKLLAISKDVVAEAGSADELSRKIYASYQQFRALIMNWSDIAERAYLNSRRLS